jgi:hypothetical protein
MDELVLLPRFRSFADLPNHIRVQVLRWGEPDAEEWVHQRIPALDYRSIIETMNLPDGEQKILEFFRDLRGMLT